MKITDLASDAALSAGIVKNNMFLRLARTFERFTCSKALAVVCLCQGFIDRLSERGVAPEKLHPISDWGNTAPVPSGVQDAGFRHAHAIPSTAFLAMHTGNMGRKQDPQNMVRAAQLSRQDSGLLWLLVGEGEERAALEKEILHHELTNIRLLPLQPPETVPLGRIWASPRTFQLTPGLRFRCWPALCGLFCRALQGHQPGRTLSRAHRRQSRGGACFATSTVLLTALYFTRNAEFPRGFFALSVAVLLFLAVILRALFRVLFRSRLDSSLRTRLLIIGTGRFARDAASRLQRLSFAPCSVAAFVHLPGQEVAVENCTLLELEELCAPATTLSVMQSCQTS